MAPAHSKLHDASQVADRLTHHMASDPPPIKFMRSDRASKSPSDTMYHEFEYRLDSADKKSTKIVHCGNTGSSKRSKRGFWTIGKIRGESM